MEKYKNLSRKSAITHYGIGDEYIDVKFEGKSTIYNYSYSVTGRFHIDTMKILALKGKGLCTYITQNPEVKNKFKKR